MGAAVSALALRLGRRSGMELGAVGEQVLFGARFKLCLWWALVSDREVDSCLDFSIRHENPLETTLVRFEKTGPNRTGSPPAPTGSTQIRRVRAVDPPPMDGVVVLRPKDVRGPLSGRKLIQRNCLRDSTKGP